MGEHRMSRRDYDDYDDRYDDRYSEGNDRYDDRYDDGYDDRYDDGYQDAYDDRRDGYDDGYGDGYDDRYDDGYDDRYDDRYGDRYDDGYDDRYEDEYDDDYGRRSSSRGKSAQRGSKAAERSGRSGKKGKKKKGINPVIIVIEVVVLAAVLLVLYFVNSIGKMEKVNLPTEEIVNNMSDEVIADAESGEMKGYRNIAFFGVDSTEGDLDQNTRSDAIMICSINEDTGEVKLVSVYRDTLLNIGDGTYTKCNSAYAQGGAEQAINMLNQNLDMNITDFVTVGFGGLTDVVDALGGVTITVEEDEISHLNNYQSTMAKELGKSGYTEVTSAGTQTLNGLQATAYCRIRYTRGWDYKRAARQRAVLYAVMDKAKTASVSQLTEIVNSVSDEIYTSYKVSDLIKDVEAISSYSVDAEDSIDSMQNGFPQEDTRIQANLGGALGDCVIPRDLTDNVKWLHEFLFDDSSYDPSDTVKEYSDHIAEMTKDAVAEEMTDADHT